MKLRKPVLLPAFCYITATCFCQKPPTETSVRIFLSPVLLPSPAQRFGGQAGFQYTFGSWAATAEGALPFRKYYDDFSRITYVRLGLELKRLLPIEGALKGYVSLQNNYSIRQMTDTNGNTYARKTPPGVFRFNSAVISSPIFSTAVKGGLELPMSKRLYFDYFFGLGVRVITTSYKNVEGARPTQFYEPADCCSFRPVYQYEGRYTKLHMATGLRLGYVLK